MVIFIGRMLGKTDEDGWVGLLAMGWSDRVGVGLAIHSMGYEREYSNVYKE